MDVTVDFAGDFEESEAMQRHRKLYKSLIPPGKDIDRAGFDPATFMAETRARGEALCDGAAVQLSVSRLSLVAGGAHNMYTVVLQTGMLHVVAIPATALADVGLPSPQRRCTLSRSRWTSSKPTTLLCTQTP